MPSSGRSYVAIRPWHRLLKSIITGAIALGLVASLFASPIPPASAQNGSGSEAQDDASTDTNQGDSDPKEFQPCKKPNTTRVEVVLTMDESGSLGGKQEQRNDALKSLRDKLAKQLDRLKLKDISVDVQIALIGFNSRATEDPKLAPVTTEFPSDQQIEALKATGVTDYAVALKKALEVFEMSKHVNSDTTCRVFVFITDGVYDPTGTVAQKVPAEEPAAKRAKTSGKMLVDSVCDVTNGEGSTLNNLEIETYAILIGEDFKKDPTDQSTHEREMAEISKQFILALIGQNPSGIQSDTQSYLQQGVDETFFQTCHRASGRADSPQGVAISLENIQGLTEALEKVVTGISLGLRRPSLNCENQDGETQHVAHIKGDWPGEAEAPSVCRVILPLDGITTLSVRSDGDQPLNWKIGADGYEGSSQLTISQTSKSTVDKEEIEIRLHTTLTNNTRTPMNNVPLTISMVWDPSWDPVPADKDNIPVETLINLGIPDRGPVFPPDLDCEDTTADTTGETPIAKRVCSVTAPNSAELDVTVIDVQKQYDKGPSTNLSDMFFSPYLDLTWPTFNDWSLGFGPFIQEVKVLMRWKYPGGDYWQKTDSVLVTLDWSPNQDLLNGLAAGLLDCKYDELQIGGSDVPWSDLQLPVDTDCIANPPPVGSATFTSTFTPEPSGDITWKLENEEFKLEAGESPKPLRITTDSLKDAGNRRYDESGMVEFSAEWQPPGANNVLRDSESILVSTVLAQVPNELLAWLGAAGLLLLLLLLAWLAWLMIARARQGAPGRLLPKARGWTWTEKQFPVVDRSGMATSPELEKFSPERSGFSRVSTLNGGWNMGRLRLRLRKTFHPWATPEVQVSAEEFHKLHCDPAGPTASTLRPPMRDGFVVAAAQPNQITTWIAMPPNGNLEHLVEKVKVVGRATLSDLARFDHNQPGPSTSQSAPSGSDRASQTGSSAHPSEPPPPPRPSKPTPIGDLATAQATLNPTAEPPTQPSKPPPPPSKPPPISRRTPTPATSTPTKVNPSTPPSKPPPPPSKPPPIGGRNPTKATSTPTSGNPSTPPSKPTPPPSKPPPIGGKPPPMGRTPGRPSKPPRKPR